MCEIVLSITPLINEIEYIVINGVSSGTIWFILAIITSTMSVLFYNEKTPDWLPLVIISTILWAMGIICAVTYSGIFTFKVI